MRRVVAVLMLTVPLTAADWPEFRGPTGDGHVPGPPPPVQWGPKTNLAWMQEMTGLAWSSPSVAAGKIFLTNAETIGDDLVLSALAHDAATGKELWKTELFRGKVSSFPRIHNKNSHASPTAIVDGGDVFVHFGHQGTACLTTTGKVVWKTDKLKYAPVHGNGGSPVLYKGRLYFSADGSDQQFIAALDRKTGDVVWKTNRPTKATRKFSFTTPTVIEVNGKALLISPGSDMVNALDADSGKIIWTVRYDGYSVIPKPVYGHGLLFICTGYNTPSLLAIKPDGSGDITDTHIVWQAKKAVPHTPSLLLVGNELYMVSDNGIGSCLDAKTGKVHWSERLSTGGYSASPIHADGKIYFLSEQGEGVVVRAGREFDVLAKNKLDERTLASYAVTDGALFVRTEKHLYRFETK